jgi:ferredoxin
MWRVTVNDTCISSAMCIGTAPEHFQFNEQQRSQPVRSEIEPNDLVRAAAANCPMEAILIVDVDTGEVLEGVEPE